MSFAAYLETIRTRTGKTPDELHQLAEEQGLMADGAVAPGVKAGDVIAWLARALFSGLKTAASR